jgi:hypothetical protein
MTHRLLSLVVFAFLFVATATGQGIFLRVAPQYDILQQRYDSPWAELITFDTRTSYGVGGDAGIVLQPRRFAVNVRLSSGVSYQWAKLKASIGSKDMIDSGFVVNTGVEESYEFLTIPVTVEVLYASRTARLSPGLYITYNNTFVKRSAGTSMRVDGSRESYDIPVTDYIPSASVGGFLDIAISRTLAFETAAGYTVMFRNILKDSDAYLRFQSINFKAGLVLRLK